MSVEFDSKKKSSGDVEKAAYKVDCVREIANIIVQIVWLYGFLPRWMCITPLFWFCKLLCAFEQNANKFRARVLCLKALWNR